MRTSPLHWVKAPTSDELTQITHTIAHRVARYLECQGLLVRDAGNSYLTAKGVDTDPESPMIQLLGHSITYRIAVGPQQGRNVFTLQTLPDWFLWCQNQELTLGRFISTLILPEAILANA